MSVKICKLIFAALIVFPAWSATIINLSATATPTTGTCTTGSAVSTTCEFATFDFTGQSYQGLNILTDIKLTFTMQQATNTGVQVRFTQPNGYFSARPPAFPNETMTTATLTSADLQGFGVNTLFSDFPQIGFYLLVYRQEPTTVATAIVQPSTATLEITGVNDPTVPEPATLFTALPAIALVLLRRRRSRCAI